MSVTTSDMNESGKERGLLKNAILIAGPTASGKSALALDWAERQGGVLVNTDSMQGYSVLNVLTARPSEADMRRAPHFLYGHVSPATPYSTGMWLRDVMRLMDEGVFKDKVPIFVGGTGLYFKALAGGLSAMPEIPAPVRERWRARLAQEGAEHLHRLLAKDDPEMASRLRPGDGQRILRALEVLEASGRSILMWQEAMGPSLIDRASAQFFVMRLERAQLVHRIDRRFEHMLEQGGLEEVRALSAMGLDPALPAMKAIGVRELQAADAGEISFDEAVLRAKIATRQYAKRQSTWFRNQLGPEWKTLPPCVP